VIFIAEDAEDAEDAEEEGAVAVFAAVCERVSHIVRDNWIGEPTAIAVFAAFHIFAAGGGGHSRLCPYSPQCCSRLEE